MGIPSIDIFTKKLQTIIVDENGGVTYEIVDRTEPFEPPPQHLRLDEEWRNVREKRDRLLAESDWIVARAYEQGKKVPPEWQQYRQALRDITHHRNPFLVQWPYKPTVGPSGGTVYEWESVDE